MTSITRLSIAVATFGLASCHAEPDRDPDRGQTVQEAIIECLWCATGPSPAPGTCQEYDCGGDSGVHYYTCCNNCDEDGPQPPDSPEYDGASPGNYCGPCGQNLGGGCLNGDPFMCGGTGGQTACANFCDACAITFPGACWNWSDCFSSCCADGDPSDGVDGWICVSLEDFSLSSSDVELARQAETECELRKDLTIAVEQVELDQP